MNNRTPLRYSLTPSGNQPTVMLLHGFLGCRHDWDEVVDQLGGPYRYLAVDLPGHGALSDDLPPDAYSISGCAGLLVDLLDECEISRCHLVGYSMGGRLALYLLTHYSDRFLSAVIESASPGLRTEAERAARLEQDGIWIRSLLERPLDEFLNEWLAQPLFDTIDRTTARFEKTMWHRRQHDPVSLARSLEHLGTGAMPSLWDKLAGLTMPILFVAGEKDEKYRRLALEMARLCGRAQVAIIDGAGHNTHFECPEAFSKEVARFLRHNS